MAELTLGLLGWFRMARANGTPVRVPEGKQRALLACLAWRPAKACTRGKLAALLWGQRPEEQARHSLNQALTSLRRAVGTDVVRTDGEQLYLDPERVDVDVVRLRSLVRQGTMDALEEALSLCEAGEFLDGLNVDEPEFEEWLEQARAEVEAVRETVHEQLLDRAATRGDPQRAAEAASALLERDPLNEGAHRGLMHALAIQGRVERSLRQYEKCRVRLNEELGIDPTTETQSLAGAIRAGEIPGSSVVSPGGPDRLTGPPVVAVLRLLPIESGEPVKHIASGMAFGLISELSRFRSIQVIGRDTAFQLHAGLDGAVSGARDVGADYVLTGSVEGEKGRIRVEVRLVDTETDVHVWSERYDVGVGEFFDVRDDTVASIVGTVAPLVECERVRKTRHKPVISWQAYDYYLRATDLYYAHWSSPIPPPECKALLERAIELDPECARAHALYTCVVANMDTEESVDEDFSTAIGHALKAMALDPRDTQAPRVLGALYTILGRFEESWHHLQRALRLNPNDADLAVHEARYCALAGNPEGAVEPFERARRLNPLHRGWYWSVAATAYHLRGDYGEAIAALERMEERTFIDHLYTAACRAELGEEKEAHRALQRALVERPELTRSSVARYLPYREASDREHLLRGLAAAGMPP